MFVRLKKTYPLTRFQEWLLATKGVTRATAPTYLSAVRHALAAVQGDYLNDRRLTDYLQTLSLAKYRATVTGWRHFTEYLHTLGKAAVDLTPVKPGGETEGEDGEEGLDTAVRALREVYGWIMTDGRRIGAYRLSRARFHERRGTAWSVLFDEKQGPLLCSPKITPALNVLYERAGRPANPEGCLLWPEAPGGDEECPWKEFKKLIGRLLVTVGGVPSCVLHEAPLPAPREVIPNLPGMDGAK